MALTADVIQISLDASTDAGEILSPGATLVVTQIDNSEVIVSNDVRIGIINAFGQTPVTGVWF